MAPPPKPKRKTPATAAAAAKKAAAGSKTSGETDLDYAKEESIRMVSKTYGLETYDKHVVTEYADGANDYYVIQFYVTGAVWDGGYLVAVGGRVHSQVESPHRRTPLQNGAPQVHHG